MDGSANRLVPQPCAVSSTARDPRGEGATTALGPDLPLLCVGVLHTCPNKGQHQD